MRVVFDTDPGIDDAMALLYLHACKSIELMGITTILGNASIDRVTANACILCDQFGIAAPIYRGEGQSLDGSTGDYPDFVHGTNGLGDVVLPDPVRQIESESAAEYLCRITREYPGEITVIAVGRMTNLGRALQLDPEFPGRLHGLILMGGAIKHEGNVTAWAEANIIGDPEAAAALFDSGVPVSLVGLDVTMQTRMSHAHLASITDPLGRLGQFLHHINQNYAAFYAERYNLDSFPVHDSSAIAFADDPTLFTVKTGTLSCVLEGEQRGRTVLREGSGRHQVCLGVDSTRLLERYRETVLAFY